MPGEFSVASFQPMVLKGAERPQPIYQLEISLLGD